MKSEKKKATAKSSVKIKDLAAKKNPKGGSGLKSWIGASGALNVSGGGGGAGKTQAGWIE